MKELVVIGVVKFKDKILLLKRSDNRRISPSLWQVVSGFIDKGETREQAVLREVKEETGLNGKIVKVGKVFDSIDDYGEWTNCPFLIQVDSDQVIIDKNEHSEYAWIYPKEIDTFNIIKAVHEDLKLIGLI